MAWCWWCGQRVRIQANDCFRRNRGTKSESTTSSESLRRSTEGGSTGASMRCRWSASVANYGCGPPSTSRSACSAVPSFPTDAGLCYRDGSHHTGYPVWQEDHLRHRRSVSVSRQNATSVLSRRRSEPVVSRRNLATSSSPTVRLRPMSTRRNPVATSKSSIVVAHNTPTS